MIGALNNDVASCSNSNSVKEFEIGESLCFALGANHRCRHLFKAGIASQVVIVYAVKWSPVLWAG
jgi:hypothetical protein